MNRNKIHGAIQIALACVWVCWYGNLWYQYHVLQLLFMYMLPDWIIYVNILLGLIGIWLGGRTFLGRLKYYVGCIYLLTGITLGFGLDFMN